MLCNISFIIILLLRLLFLIMVTRTKHACIICEFLLSNNYIDKYNYDKICGTICHEINFDYEYNNNLSKHLVDYCINLKIDNPGINIGTFDLSRFWILEIGTLIQTNYLLSLQFFIDNQSHTFPFAKIEMLFDRFFYFTIDPVIFSSIKEEGYKFCVEYHLNQLFNLVRSLIPSINYPRKIYVKFPQPEGKDFYKEYFNCEVIYSADENKISFGISKSALTQKLDPISYLKIDEKIRAFLKLSEAIKKSESEFKSKITYILNSSGNILPNEDMIANKLNIHPRTLRRKLKAEGESFRKLITEYKMKKAINLLTMTKLNYKQIAFQLGYKSSTSFSKSFKDWTGYTPQKYRNKK